MVQETTQHESAPSQATTPGSPGTAVTKQDTPGGLQTEKGTTTIANSVVTKIAGIAAREVAGVHKLGGGVARALGAVTQRLPGGESPSQGVSVETPWTSRWWWSTGSRSRTSPSRSVRTLCNASRV
jgi:hypothetical protein